MKRIQMGHMPRIGKKPLSAFDLSNIVPRLEFVSPVLRVVKGRVVCQMRPDKGKKTVLRVLCDCYPNVWLGVPEIAKRSGYSIRHVGRILRELELKDKLIVDINSRLISKNKKLVGSDDAGKKGGSGKGCTPQYFICDRRIYDIFQQQQELVRVDKETKKLGRLSKTLTSQNLNPDISETSPNSKPGHPSNNPDILERSPDMSEPKPRHISIQNSPNPDTMADEPVMLCNQSLGTSQVGTNHVKPMNEPVVGTQETEAAEKQEPQRQEPRKAGKAGSKPSPSLSSHDMTMTGQQFEGLFAEDVIHAVSDGEFNLAALKSYDCTGELTDACRAAVQQMQNQPFVDRTTCAEIMSRAMEILDAQSIKAPRGWLPVLKKLRIEGGPARVGAPEPFKPVRPAVQPDQVLVDKSSALHFYEEPLKPFHDLLVETAKYRGVPQRWADAVPFLDCAIEGDIPPDELTGLIAVRDEIQSRIPARAAH